MGEHEPDDSRDVTLKPGHEPGGIERTGPKEGEVRKKAEKRDQQKNPRVTKGDQMRQQQQQGVQTQSQGSGSQAQSSGSPGGTQSQPQTEKEQAELEEEARDLNASPRGPLAGNQPQAGNLPGGEARPEYDQYEVNSPSAMQQPQQVGADQQREQAAAQRDQSGAENDERSGSGEKGLGYGAEDGEEMADAPDVTKRGYGDADKARGESEG